MAASYSRADVWAHPPGMGSGICKTKNKCSAVVNVHVHVYTCVLVFGY